MDKIVGLPKYPTKKERKLAEIVAPLIGLRLTKATVKMGGSLFLVFMQDNSDKGWGVDIDATSEGLFVSRITTRKCGTKVEINKNGIIKTKKIDIP